MSPNSSRFDRSLVRPAVHDRVSRLAAGATAVERALWTVVLVASLADVALTVVGLHAGLPETNPLVVAAIERFGPVALVGLKAVAIAVGLAGWAAVAPAYRGLVPLGLALVWVVATANNVVAVGLALLAG